MSYKITALSVQKRNHQRVNVYLDGEFAFGLTRIVAAWLSIGQEFNDEKIERLKAEDALECAYQQAIGFLQYRPRAEAEIRQNLQHHKIEPEIIDATLERLARNGLVDDARFAEAWVENRVDLRPRSRRALAYELSRRGVEREQIDQALSKLDDDELAYQAAALAVRKRASTYETLEWQEFRTKLLRHLAQRGFSYDAGAQAVSRVWQEQQHPESIPGEESPNDQR